jgi:hypothetical protein
MNAAFIYLWAVVVFKIYLNQKKKFKTKLVEMLSVILFIVPPALLLFFKQGEGGYIKFNFFHYQGPEYPIISAQAFAIQFGWLSTLLIPVILLLRLVIMQSDKKALLVLGIVLAGNLGLVNFTSIAFGWHDIDAISPPFVPFIILFLGAIFSSYDKVEKWRNEILLILCFCFWLFGPFVIINANGNILKKVDRVALTSPAPYFHPTKTGAYIHFGLVFKDNVTVYPDDNRIKAASVRKFVQGAEKMPERPMHYLYAAIWANAFAMKDSSTKFLTLFLERFPEMYSNLLRPSCFRKKSDIEIAPLAYEVAKKLDNENPDNTYYKQLINYYRKHRKAYGIEDKYN